MIVYIILIAYILFVSAIYNKSNKDKITTNVYFIFILTALVLISGMRSYKIGVDTSSYTILFNKLPYMNSFQIENLYYEKGFILFNKVLRFLTDNDQWLIFISSLIINIGVVIFIKNNSKIAGVSVYLFITLAYYYNSMNIMRQYIAMAIIIISYKFVKEKKIVPFILSVILATTFHTTALISILIYFIPNIKISFKKIFTIVLFSIILYMAIPNLLNIFFRYFNSYDGYIKYLNSENIGDTIKFLIMLSILSFGLIMRFNRNNNFFEENNRLTIIILISVIISFLAIRISVLSRVADYFGIFSIIYIPNVIDIIKNKRLKIFIMYFILMLCLIYNFILISSRPEWFMVTPYKFFWQ